MEGSVNYKIQTKCITTLHKLLCILYCMLIYISCAYAAPNTKEDTTNRKIFNVSITCGEKVESREAVLEILPCGNLIPSYYDTNTTLKHLIQGCAFHNRIRGGSSVIVKRVINSGVDPQGRVVFIDRSTDGILRIDGTISTREAPGNPYLVLDGIPSDCPKIKG